MRGGDREEGQVPVCGGRGGFYSPKRSETDANAAKATEKNC